MAGTGCDPHILVGYDGSPQSEQALEWGVEEARLRQLPLTVCHAWHWPYPFRQQTDGIAKITQEMGQVVLNSGVTAARRLGDELDVRPLLVKGLPHAAILDAGCGAELIVLGSRGNGGFEELPVGSVAAQVPAYAVCPVIVVRPLPAGRPHPVRILVGVDGSSTSEAALGFAFQEAALRDGTVHVLCSWWDPGALPGPERAAFTDPEAVRQEAQTRFERAIAPWRANWPEVPLETDFQIESPRRALLAAAGDATLLVVGDRGLGSAPGMLLGPVAQAVLHEAPCPVAVVHAPNRSRYQRGPKQCPAAEAA
ncbi:universal stress protein [Actinomadura scrupuli]|uniref:universal stress protein n=1 Tax=Actinomadura scrupuli TaxID=559629 RepID=UPI003D99678D